MSDRRRYLLLASLLMFTACAGLGWWRHEEAVTVMENDETSESYAVVRTYHLMRLMEINTRLFAENDRLQEELDKCLRGHKVKHSSGSPLHRD